MLRWLKALLLLSGSAFLIGGTCVLYQINSAVKDFRVVEAKTQVTLETTTRAVSDTSSMINANLIHLDLILGRAERVSRSQEAYWNMMATKSALMLDHADKVLVDLDQNQNALTLEGINTLRDTQDSIVMLGTTIQHTDATLNGPEIKAILANTQAGTASLAQTSSHIEGATKDIQEQVHSITHPKVITKVATWTLRVFHAVGSWFKF